MRVYGFRQIIAISNSQNTEDVPEVFQNSKAVHAHVHVHVRAAWDVEWFRGNRLDVVRTRYVRGC